MYLTTLFAWCVSFKQTFKHLVRGGKMGGLGNGLRLKTKSKRLDCVKLQTLGLYFFYKLNLLNISTRLYYNNNDLFFLSKGYFRSCKHYIHTFGDF